jgi:hypothetical protein
MKNDFDYLDEFLRDVRRIFPNARLVEVIDEYGEHRLVKRCVICGVEYLGWLESEFCSNECARQHDTGENPTRKQIKNLRRAIRGSWEVHCQETGSESLDRWLRNFEAHLEWRRNNP